MKKQLWMVLVLAIGMVGCAQTPQEEGEVQVSDSTTESVEVAHENDPLEGFNRVMWDFNYEILDPYLVRPVSLGYVNYVPDPAREMIRNFLSNLDEPSSMVNSILMGNGKDAVLHFNRFWINTFFGLGGVIDIATAAEITKKDNVAFGDALGSYGVGHGPYLMVPGYGPTTVRNLTDTVDGLYVPLTYLNFWQGLGKWALEGMESRAALVSQEPLLEASPDPYALTRDAYIQRQDFKAGIVEEEDPEEEAMLDDFLDEIDE